MTITLAPYEQVLRTTRLHSGIFIPPVFVGLFLALPALFMGMGLHSLSRSFGKPSLLPFLVAVPLVLLPTLVAFFDAWVAYAQSKLVLTNRRLFFSKGFIFRSVHEIPLQQVETLSRSEPLIGRFMGYGTVSVTGTGGAAFVLCYLPDAPGFHQQLQAAVEAVRPHGTPPNRPTC
jgi:Bacterial PH domain